MVKKYLVFTILFVLLATPSYAESNTDATTSSKTRNNEVSKMLRQEEVKDKRELVKDEMQLKRVKFQEEIQKIKDEKKKEIVERITNKIQEINMTQTQQMNTVLSRLAIILGYIEEQGLAAKTNGQNTVTLDRTAAAAKTAITTAQTQVDAQAAKEYTTTITTDTALRGVIGAMVSTFRTDLTATRKYVLDAREAVIKARAELLQLKGEGTNTATGSANTQ